MKLFMLLIFGMLCIHTNAQKVEDNQFTKQELAVKSVVDQFLIAAGNYDLVGMDSLFTENANIGGASLRDDKWVTYAVTFDEFKAMLKSVEDPVKYTEPVSDYTIHISEDRLAFVKADAQVLRDGLPPRTNYDYFTLMKIEGQWKILNGSYVSIPAN